MACFQEVLEAGLREDSKNLRRSEKGSAFATSASASACAAFAAARAAAAFAAADSATATLAAGRPAAAHFTTRAPARGLGGPAGAAGALRPGRGPFSDDGRIDPDGLAAALAFLPGRFDARRLTAHIPLP